MPRDGSATRTRILDVAERLVIDNGFAATSLDQVISAARTSKGAFFHHFDSKQDLAVHLVARYAAADIAHLEQALEQTRDLADPAQRLLAFLRIFEEGADELMSAQSSCLYVAILTERQLVDAGTAADIRRAVLAWREELAALFRAALGDRARTWTDPTEPDPTEPGPTEPDNAAPDNAAPDQEEPDPGTPNPGAPVPAEPARAQPGEAALDPEALADHVFVTFEGAFILCRTLDDPGLMGAQLRALRLLVAGLLAAPPTA